MRALGWLVLAVLSACARDGREAASTPPADEAAATATPQQPSPEPSPTSQPVAAREQEAPTSQPADDGYDATPPTVAADGSEVYGAALDPDVNEVPLAALLSAPERYADSAVRTSGTVARVCKNMGCWMELRGDDPAQQVRAPMAGHAFFLPQKVVGRRATVQGSVHMRELTPAQKAHFKAEGAQAVDVQVSIEATAVAVR